MARQKRESNQLKFNFQEKLFSLESLANSKLAELHSRVTYLTFSEMKWVSNCEDFWTEKGYMTEKQFEVLDAILNKTKDRVSMKYKGLF